jgi:hypothetical protein
MTIRNALLAAGSIVALSAFAGGAFAAGSVQATANATLTVLSPTTLTKTQDMLFGTVTRPSAGTTVVSLDTADTVTVANSGGGDGTVVSSTTSSAKFNLTSAAGISYTTTQVLTFAQTGLTNITATTPAVNTGVLGTLGTPGGGAGSGGTQILSVGGGFTMTAATQAQPYTGTLTVTVNYN